MREWPASAELYLPAPRPGTLFRNRALAATYRRIVDEAGHGSREARIDRALGFPTHDPHGDPIPNANLEWPQEG